MQTPIKAAAKRGVGGPCRRMFRDCCLKTRFLVDHAAERPKNVAPGSSPGFVLVLDTAPEGRKTSRRIVRPFRGSAFSRHEYPGLAPGATFLSRSAAGTASSEANIVAAFLITGPRWAWPSIS